MLAKKQLQELAIALKATPEYTEMIRQRRKIMSSPPLSRLMQNFEKEHRRLLNLDLPEKEAAAKLEKLYTDNRNFLESEDIRRYIKTTRDYQKMVLENINYLNMMLDTGDTGKQY
jgi:cell fate (sporulation/competence/biofilm development) regulator YlbF (YheA/YmcA/DUF963 family)